MLTIYKDISTEGEDFSNCFLLCQWNSATRTNDSLTHSPTNSTSIYESMMMRRMRMRKEAGRQKSRFREFAYLILILIWIWINHCIVFAKYTPVECIIIIQRFPNIFHPQAYCLISWSRGWLSFISYIITIPKGPLTN